MALAISRFRLIYPDERNLTATWEVELPSNWDFATTKTLAGYWYGVGASNAPVRSTGDDAVIANKLYLPCVTPSPRGDVRQNKKVTLFDGHIYFETSVYETGTGITYSVGDDLMLKNDGTTGNAQLTPRTGTNPIYARVIQVPVADENGLIAVKFPVVA
jgi:hypothetical protein